MLRQISLAVRNTSLTIGALFLGADFAINLWFIVSGKAYQEAIAPALMSELRVYGFLAVLIGLVLGAVVASGWKRRLLWLLGAVPSLLILFLTFVFLMISAGTPVEINRVQLADGRLVMLGIQPVPTDEVYDLWQAKDARGLVWQNLSDVSLSYSEDGSWTKDPALVATPDGKHLLVRRGGIWTDCLVIAERLNACPGVSSTLDWTKPAEWLEQSDHIVRITGLSPGHVEERQPVRSFMQN
ncbi:hypothetical protein [Microvirga terrestris]|uniref:Uncharacterized protein n=1 Tax=Microvirga terrestris TaxID=2791024 RepID=A0ABS0HQ13_9HYPH|nr:hypothetical protein [Microvirga terrestris]MBF9195317.1 hypothetical protein [Microvirga terrestris]